MHIPRNGAHGRNGGSIDIKSEVGKGTEVVIKVPTKAKEDKK